MSVSAALSNITKQYAASGEKLVRSLPRRRLDRNGRLSVDPNEDANWFECYALAQDLYYGIRHELTGGGRYLLRPEYLTLWNATEDTMSKIDAAARA